MLVFRLLSAKYFSFDIFCNTKYSIILVLFTIYSLFRLLYRNGNHNHSSIALFLNIIIFTIHSSLSLLYCYVFTNYSAGNLCIFKLLNSMCMLIFRKCSANIKLDKPHSQFYNLSMNCRQSPKKMCRQIQTNITRNDILSHFRRTYEYRNCYGL